MPSVMLIDRRPCEWAGLAAALQGAGHEVTLIDQSDTAPDIIRRSRPAIILVGRLSTDMFRNEFCAQVRRVVPASTSGIIVLMPGATRLTRIACLEDGADDVVDHDISADRLIARIRALRAPLCRHGEAPVLRYGPLEMSIDELKVRACGTPLALAPTTFQILRSFLERPEQILSRTDLLATCNRIASSRSLYEHVRLLRQAMAPFGLGNPILTMPPSGYMLSMR